MHTFVCWITTTFLWFHGDHQQEEICGLLLWSSALITLQHHCSNSLTSSGQELGQTWSRTCLRTEWEAVSGWWKPMRPLIRVGFSTGCARERDCSQAHGPAPAQVDACLYWHLEAKHGIVPHWGRTKHAMKWKADTIEWHVSMELCIFITLQETPPPNLPKVVSTLQKVSHVFVSQVTRITNLFSGTFKIVAVNFVLLHNCCPAAVQHALLIFWFCMCFFSRSVTAYTATVEDSHSLPENTLTIMHPTYKGHL